MSVVRAERRGRFTVLATAPLRLASLSLRARGLWALCMSYPDDWEFRAGHLLAQTEREGRDAVRTALRELEAAGFARLVRQTTADGRLGGSRWVVFEEPQGDAPEGGLCPDPPTLPLPDDRASEHPADGPAGQLETRPPENPPLRSTEQDGAPTERKNEQQHARASGALPPGTTPLHEAMADAAGALQKSAEAANPLAEGAATQLARRGIEQGVAHDLARRHGAASVERAVALYDQRRRGPKPPSGPGWLVAALRRGYADEAPAAEATPLLSHAEMLRWCEANGGLHRTAEFAPVPQPDGPPRFRRRDSSSSHSPYTPRPSDR